MCGPFKIPGFSGRRYFNRLVPTPFFLEHGSAAKTLISHPHNTASYAGYLNWPFYFLPLDTYRACGDHRQAIHIWKTETLPLYKDELGDHPWTASILRYIASSYRCLAKSESADSGIADVAEMYSREALQLRIKLLREHQDTARSHVDLSDVLIIKKDFKSALEQLQKAIEIQKDVLGEEHETTKKTLMQLNEIQSKVE